MRVTTPTSEGGDPAIPVPPPPEPPAPPQPPEPGPSSHDEERPPQPPRALTPRTIGIAVGVWFAVTAVAIGLVLYGIGPLLEQRDQTALLSEYRGDIRRAANQTLGLPGVEVPTRAPATGTPVAILDIGALKIEQVVLEGVGPQQTRRGPGHVPGTAAPGQPGNSAIVARRSAFGGPFRTLGQLEPGDEILVTTIQGQTIYEVVQVRSDEVGEGTGMTSVDDTSDDSAATTTTSTTAVSAEDEEGGAADEGERDGEDVAQELLPDELTNDSLYGPTPDDRLTLVTSASTRPWNTARATIVVAAMRDRPFAPTPQGGRTAADDGRSGDSSAGAPLLLAVLAYVVAVVTAVVLYRKARPRSAYLLTAPPLLAATMLTAEAVARMLPAWL
jgi:sortase A